MSRGPKIVDITGLRVGRLTVLGLSHKKVKSTSSKIGGSTLFWKYRCDCGNEGFASGANLKRGITQSCGCLHKERFKNETHGLCRHPSYQSWLALNKRCKNESQINFKNYGGRGISVCDKWLTFEGFWADMGSSWFEGATIERKDVNGNYEPENCIWLEAEKQAANRRITLWIETPWGRMTAADAARKSGVPYEVIRVRWHQGKRGDELFEPSQRAIPTEAPK